MNLVLVLKALEMLQVFFAALFIFSKEILIVKGGLEGSRLYGIEMGMRIIDWYAVQSRYQVWLLLHVYMICNGYIKIQMIFKKYKQSDVKIYCSEILKSFANKFSTDYWISDELVDAPSHNGYIMPTVIDFHFQLDHMEKKLWVGIHILVLLLPWSQPFLVFM